MCGDPPNIIIGTALGYTFADFALNTGVIAWIGMAVALIFFYLAFRKTLMTSNNNSLEAAIRYPKPAEAIRERFRLRDFMDALTAQGKATAVFIGCLPYFITGMTYIMAPGYIIPFLNHPVARIIFIGMIIWEGIGFYILIRLCTFEV